MSPLLVAIIISVFAMIVVACGLKLIDLGSSLAKPIQKAGPTVACLLGIVAVFNFLLIDTLELMTVQNIILVGIISLLAFVFLRYIFDITRRGLLIPKRAKSRKSGRMSKLSVAGIMGLDLVSGIMAGAVAGMSFTLNIGTGIVVVCAFMALLLDQKIELIRRYQVAHFKRSENILALTLTLVVFPVATGFVCSIARRYYPVMGAFMAVSLGYLLSWSLYKVIEIVKTLRKS